MMIQMMPLTKMMIYSRQTEKSSKEGEMIGEKSNRSNTCNNNRCVKK